MSLTFQIKPRVDLPVGRNLQDHFAVILLNILIDKQLSFVPERDFGVSVLTDYLFHGKGELMILSVHFSQTFCTIKRRSSLTQAL